MYTLTRLKPADLDSLIEIAAHTGPGLTSLPHDASVLEKKVAASTTCWETDIRSRRGQVALRGA